MKQDYLQIRVLELAPQVYVSGQLFEHDVRLLAKQGVRSIVNNRKDDEAPGQPRSADLAKIADELGVTFVHFPVDSASMSPQEAAAFAQVCGDLERPIHIFCRSGMRSIRLWEMAEATESEP